jgi:hypothetical protein
MKWYVIKTREIDIEEGELDIQTMPMPIAFNTIEEVKEYVEDNMHLCDTWILCHGEIFELYGPSSIEELGEE